jgi:hypothetical protein
MAFKEIGRDAVDWINLAEDRDKYRALWIMVRNCRVP